MSFGVTRAVVGRNAVRVHAASLPSVQRTDFSWMIVNHAVSIYQEMVQSSTSQMQVVLMEAS